MNRFFTLLFAASCLTAVGQQQIVTCQLPVELSLENTEGNFISWNSIETNQQTFLAEETGTFTATVADANRGLNGTVDGFMEVAEIPGYESNAHTVSLWIRPSSTDGIQDLISKDGECGPRQWLLSLQDGEYHAHVWLEDHSLVMFVTEDIASAGVWTHLAQVWDGQTLQLFVNGQLAGQLPCEGSLATGDEPLRICGGAAAGCNQYEGDCETDDVTLWDRALSAVELSMVYEGQAEVFSDCLSRWTFDEFEDPLKDIGSAGNQDINNSLPFFTELINVSTTEFEVIEAQCDLLEICGPGTIWDAEVQMCMVSNPADINLDGCVQLNDLLDLLSAYGDCGAEESPWQCGDPLEYQGYDYATVQIGEQCWFAENLRAESYRNGDSLQYDLSDIDWIASLEGALTVYGAESGCTESVPEFDACDPMYAYDEYGFLYNWWSISDARKICPIGWSPPTVSDWEALTANVGGSSSAGLVLKSSQGWSNQSGNNGNGLDAVSFTAKPGGYLWGTGSEVNNYQAGIGAYWWARDSDLDPYAYYLKDSKDESFTSTFSPQHGFSIRCIKDAE